MPVVFTVLVVLAVVVASLFEILPTFLIRSNVPTIASVKPYTPLELYGRDIYIREGCYNCHSQMVRPFRYETERYGEYSKPGESVYDHPSSGDRAASGRIWRGKAASTRTSGTCATSQTRATVTPQSIMPSYAALLKTTPIPWDVIPKRIDAMAMLGVPYGDAVNNGVAMAKAQAVQVAADIAKRAARPASQDKEIVAIVAYLQRLGQDIKANSGVPK